MDVEFYFHTTINHLKIKIMNWLKKLQERRLRTRIALNARYGVNDLQAVYGFVKNSGADAVGVFSNDVFLKGRFINATDGSIQVNPREDPAGEVAGSLNAAEGKLL